MASTSQLGFHPNVEQILTKFPKNWQKKIKMNAGEYQERWVVQIKLVLIFQLRGQPAMQEEDIIKRVPVIPQTVKNNVENMMETWHLS